MVHNAQSVCSISIITFPGDVCAIGTGTRMVMSAVQASALGNTAQGSGGGHSVENRKT